MIELNWLDSGQQLSIKEIEDAQVRLNIPCPGSFGVCFKPCRSEQPKSNVFLAIASRNLEDGLLEILERWWASMMPMCMSTNCRMEYGVSGNSLVVNCQMQLNAELLHQAWRKVKLSHSVSSLLPLSFQPCVALLWSISVSLDVGSLMDMVQHGGSQFGVATIDLIPLH